MNVNSTSAVMSGKNQEIFIKIVLALCIAIGVFFRFFRLGLQELWYDELFSTVSAMEPQLSGLFSNWIICDGNPPLYSLFLWLWLKVFPATEFFVRLPSAIASSLSLILIYFLGRKVVSHNAAIIATILFSFSYGGLYFAQEARSYSFLILFSILATYFWLKTIQNFSDKHLFFKHLLPFTATLIILSYLHYFGILLGCILTGYLFLLAIQRRRNIKWMFLSMVIWFLFYIPWLSQLTFLLEIDKSVWHFNGHKVIIKYFYHLFFAKHIGSRIITIFLVITITTGLIFEAVPIAKTRWNRRHHIDEKALFHISASSIFLILLMPYAIRGIEFRHFFIFFPIHYLYIGAICSHIKISRLYLILFFFAVSSIAFVFQIGDYYKVHKQQWGTSAKYVLDNSNPSTEIVILGEPQQMLPVEYAKRGMIYESFYTRNLYFYRYYFNRHNKKNLPVKLKVVKPELDNFKDYIKTFSQNDSLKEIFILGGHHLKLDKKTLDFLKLQSPDNYEEDFYSTKLYWFKLY